MKVCIIILKHIHSTLDILTPYSICCMLYEAMRLDSLTVYALYCDNTILQQNFKLEFRLVLGLRYGLWYWLALGLGYGLGFWLEYKLGLFAIQCCRNIVHKTPLTTNCKSNR